MPIVIEHACACRLCRGRNPIACPSCGGPIDRWACASCGLTSAGGATPLELLVEGVGLVPVDALQMTGGRDPSLVVLEPGEVFGWESARGTIDAPPEADLDDLRLELPASVHGCHKIRRHQRLLVFAAKTV